MSHASYRLAFFPQPLTCPHAGSFSKASSRRATSAAFWPAVSRPRSSSAALRVTTTSLVSPASKPGRSVWQRRRAHLPRVCLHLRRQQVLPRLPCVAVVAVALPLDEPLLGAVQDAVLQHALDHSIVLAPVLARYPAALDAVIIPMADD